MGVVILKVTVSSATFYMHCLRPLILTRDKFRHGFSPLVSRLITDVRVKVAAVFYHTTAGIVTPHCLMIQFFTLTGFEILL